MERRTLSLQRILKGRPSGNVYAIQAITTFSNNAGKIELNNVFTVVDFQPITVGLGPMLVKVTSMRPELQSQNRVDGCYGKTVGLGAWLTKALWKSNISLCLSQKEKSLTPKLTKWRPFKPQV